MNKNQAAKIIMNAASVYDKFLNNKNLLIIYGAPGKPSFIETYANDTNFCHLTGVVLNKEKLLEGIDDKQTNILSVFYSKALNQRLSSDAFEFKNKTTEQKLNVLAQTVNLSKNTKMFGEYNWARINLKTDKIAGSVSSFLGFIKTDTYYVPNTVIADDTRNNSTDTQKVLAILSKNIDDSDYNKIISVAKKIEIKPLLTKLSKNVPIDKSLYQDNDSLESRIADKIANVSTDAVCDNPRDLIELYELTKRGTVRNTDIEHISIERECTFQSFDAYLHNTIEIEHAYITLEDIEEKPNFGELHERLDKFLSPFIVKEHESLIWSPTSATWEREKELADRTDSESQIGVKSSVSHEIKTNTIDTENNATGTGTKSASDSVKNAKLTTKLAKLNATIDDFTLVPQDKSTPVDNLTHYFN